MNMNSIIELYNKIPPYDSMYDSPQYKAEDRFTYGYIRKHLPTEGTVLDIGCGTGDAIDHLYFFPHEYTGIDLSPKMIQQAKDKHVLYVFRQQNGKEVSRKYDVILCLYGGYLTIEDMLALYDHNLNAGGHLFFHIPTSHRNLTLIGKMEQEMGIPMELATETKIARGLERPGKIIKTNAFNHLKKYFPEWLYYLSIVMDAKMPYPIELYTWILFHLTK